MTISTRQPVANIKCSRNLHSQGHLFIGQVYADALWSNRPESTGGSG